MSKAAPSDAAPDLHVMERGRPYPERLSRKEYDREILLLQIELVKLQSWIRTTDQRVALLFEGRDAAGKGGAIKRFTEHLNPRQARVVALPKPNETELGQWYFQRYISQLPTSGMVLGLTIGWAMIAAIDRLSDASIPFGFPAPQLLVVLVLGILLGALASFIPARRSTRLEVLDAIAAT